MIKRYWFLFVCAVLVALAYAIRKIYGEEVAKELLPYFIAAPCAFVLVTLIRVVSRAQRIAKTSRARTKEIYAGIIGAMWIISLGVAQFQTWLNPHLWDFLAIIGLFVLLFVPYLPLKKVHTGAILLTWIILLGITPLQPWLNANFWVAIIFVAIFFLFVISLLIRNRLTRGTWLIKPPSPQN
jgi:hypothetical protein